MNKIIKKLLSIIISLILCVFVWHNFKISGNNILFVLLGTSFFVLIDKYLKDLNKRELIISLIIGLVFSVIEVVCNSVREGTSVEGVINKWLPLNLIGYTLSAMILLISFLRLMSLVPKSKFKKIDDFLDNHHKLVFIIMIVLIFISYFPFFLRYYPGVLSSDSMDQVLQTQGINELKNHHPLLHTMFISIFINFGIHVCGNANIGVALYSITQMLIMAVSFAIVNEYMRRKKVNSVYIILALLFEMLYVPNAFMSVTMWKDVLFSIWIMFFVLLNFELITNTEEFLKKKKSYVFYILITLLVMFAKKNGPYITVPSMIVIFAFNIKKYWKNLLPIFASIVIVYLSINFLVFNVLKIKNGAKGEMLSIPVQQIARTLKYHYDEIDDETKNEIDKFFNVEHIEQYYIETTSDPVKFKLNNDYYGENTGKFWSIWFKFLKRYPKTYVISFVAGSYGYYYIETSNSVISEAMEENSLGIQRNPLVNEAKFNVLVPLQSLYGLRRESVLFDVGLYFWIAIFSLGYVFYKKDYKLILAFIPLALIWVTMIVSPVYAEFRYGYPLILSLIVIVGMITIERKKNTKELKLIEGGKNG